MTPFLTAIAAMTTKRVIGLNNQLPWRLPADLKHFKHLTTGHAIIMGRKTFESIGRPLPNRRNIVLTRDVGFVAEGCEVAHDVTGALAKLAHDEEAFIIGGAEVYRLFMPLVSRLQLTLIDADISGDTYFPELELADWQVTREEHHQADSENQYHYSFIQYDKT